jgi:hypothetical protein
MARLQDWAAARLVQLVDVSPRFARPVWLDPQRATEVRVQGCTHAVGPYGSQENAMLRVNRLG